LVLYGQALTSQLVLVRLNCLTALTTTQPYQRPSLERASLGDLCPIEILSEGGLPA